MELTQEALNQYLETTKVALRKKMADPKVVCRKETVDFPPIREAALQFEDAIRSVGASLMFQLKSNGLFHYYIYW